MTQTLNPFSGRQFLDANGDPYSGGKLFIYEAGTSTKYTTTKDLAGLSNHANPIILNSKGEPADAGGSAQAIWQESTQAVKLVLAPSDDTDPPASAIATWDDISGIGSSGAGSGGSGDQWIAGPAPTYVSANSFTVDGDYTTTFQIGRRVKTTNSGGTVYGVITGSSYALTVTTVTITSDSGSLDSGLSDVSYGILSADNPSIPDIKQVNVVSDSPPTTGGTATAYTATLNISQYITDRVYSVQINADNTGAATITLDSLTAKNIKTIAGYDPIAGQLQAGMIAKFLYDGTNMVLLNPYLMDYNPFVNFLEFGADNTGTNSVTAAFNAALAHCASTGQVLYIPGGDYKFSTKPNDLDYSGINIVGHGLYSVDLIRDYAESGGNHIGLLHVTGDGTRGIHMKGFSIHATSASSGGCGISVYADGDQNLGWISLEDIQVSDQASDDWGAYSLVIDGSQRSTAPIGIRDLQLRNVYTFGAPTASAYISGIINSSWYGGGTFQAGGTNGDLVITGVSAVKTQECAFSLASLIGDLKLDYTDSASIQIAKCTNITNTANVSNVTVLGYASGTVGSSWTNSTHYPA